MTEADSITDAQVDLWQAEQAARKAERATRRAATGSQAAQVATNAAHFLAVSAHKIGVNELSLDATLVLGDLLADSSKDAIVFDWIGQPEIVISRAKLREVAAELGRKRARRSKITCTLGGGLCFSWHDGKGGLRFKSRKPCDLVCGKSCYHGARSPLTPENSIRVVFSA
jgi:hypothetical protein